MTLVLKDSAHYMECIQVVKDAHPNAEIKEVKEGELWKLVDGDNDLSSEHNSHYACWFEARKKLESK